MDGSSPIDQLGGAVGRLLDVGEEASRGLSRLLAIAVVLLLAAIAYRLITGIIQRVLRRMANGQADPVRVQRAMTVGPLLTSTTRYLLAFVVAVVILQELGIDVRALMVSAGVVGLAVGFGAQSLIKDVITGAFLLFEGLVAVGDVIEVGSHTGVVEAVGLRITRLRKFSGELRIVPNGELTAFGHLTAGWSRVVVEIGIGYEQDVDRALGALERAGREMQAAYPADLLEPFAAQGILRFGESEVVLRVHARVKAARRFDLELEARRRVKAALDAAGIVIAYPQRVVHLAEAGRIFPAKESSA